MEGNRSGRKDNQARRSMINSSHYSQDKKENYTENPTGQGSCSGASVRKNPEKRLKELLSVIGGIDSDKLMILVLMIVLAGEGADLRLILALGYILL